jgi:hypothetical protein
MRKPRAERVDHARRPRQAPCDEDLARGRRAGRQRERGLHRALLQGEPSVAMTRVAAQGLQPFREVEVSLRVERAAAEHRPLRQGCAQEVRRLRVQRAARPRADRPGRTAEPIDDAPAVHRERGTERPTELEHHERGLGELDAEPVRLVGDTQRGARDLVRRPHVDAVPLAVGRDGRQMDRARAEHDRKPRRHERTHDRAHPADAHAAVRFVLAHQQHERELTLADLLHGNERKPVTGRAEHELERAVVHERLDEQLRIGAHVAGAKAALERGLAVVEHADVERDRPRVDARHSGQTSSLAIA